MHPWLAFICFFRILFGRTLPDGALQFVPEGKALPPGDAKAEKKPEPKAEAKPEPKPEPKPEKKSAPLAQHHKDGALARNRVNTGFA